VLIALVLGKILGIMAFVLLMDKCRVAPLNKQIRPADVAMVGSMASIGLTVALFVSGEAFSDERLQGEAK
jgi:Na+/H+ antiporter NhaA